MSDIPRGMMATAASSVNRSGPRPWVAAALSILLPGLGHAYSGRYLRGLLWLSPVIAAFFGALLVLDFAVSDLVNAALSPTVLWGVFWLNIVGAVWRISAATDAFSLASAESAHVTTAIGVAVGWSMLLLLAVAPHLIVARYTLDAISLVSSVFVADGDFEVHEPVIPIGTDADIVPDPALPVVVPGSARVFESIFDESAWDPDAIKVRIKIAGDRHQSDHAPFLSFNERVGARRITVLIAGGDAGPGRGGMRTDTMIVASMHTGTGRAALFSFPRNLGSIPLPEKFKSAFEGLEKRLAPAPQPLAEGEEPPEWESCECFPDQMNSIYSHTRRWTRSYPNEVDPGMAALRDVIEGLMGVNIDYYMLLDMAAFVDLVDAIGGVDVYAQKPLQSEVSPPREGDAWAKVDIEVGWNHLDGPQALAYVRARKGSSDYARMQRQRCMVRAVAAKSHPITLLRRFPAIVDAVRHSVVTDIPRSFVADFIATASNLDFDDIQTVGFTHAYWQDERDHLGHPVPDVEKIQNKVRRVFAGLGGDKPVDVGASECDA
ncbi:MAG: LCP family protein [Actinomycetota bacterium]|nr:LCP family protein [Actinomycetota bacterium]